RLRHDRLLRRLQRLQPAGDDVDLPLQLLDAAVDVGFLRRRGAGHQHQNSYGFLDHVISPESVTKIATTLCARAQATPRSGPMTYSAVESASARNADGSMTDTDPHDGTDLPVAGSRMWPGCSESELVDSDALRSVSVTAGRSRCRGWATATSRAPRKIGRASW